MQKKKTICGTPNYIAPEVLENNKRGYSFGVDVWALGIIIYTLLVGRSPFQAETPQETYSRIRLGSYTFPTEIYINPLAVDLLSKILVPEADERLTIREVENHPFLNGPGIIPVTLSIDCLHKPPTEQYLSHHINIDPYKFQEFIQIKNRSSEIK